ncbi:pyruvate formate lyase-activating protein [Cedecea neteri]|jgi:pyruvate formate lyase activating enzyme|uniref:Pyruvate formate lyase-activating protein n=1 Tax=Cedecea neteri TaxID=158822 RepID=A0A089R922_9ENTR|nr:glycyl-radical enzyme activating protein [Cedecea neteri]AIR03100.1 pyruvate formate lyase-activating protein [Cedecea neteri]
MLFNIQRYSTHDGPGIRTVVFLKGCSLGCRWCQNPESRARECDVLLDRRLCLSGCDLCQQAAPDAVSRVGDELIIARGRLNEGTVNALRDCCPTQALTVCGEEKTAEAIMATVLRDKPFYARSGGGITLSGGEPFMQPALAKNLLKLSKAAGLNTAVESCLHVPWKYIEPSLPFLDLLLADLKHVDKARFQQWTDGNAERVMDNFRRLAARNVEMTIRVPLIPDFNADEGSIRAISDFAADEIGAKSIHFLPYHTLGINKYHLLGQPYLAASKPLDAPELLQFAEQYASQKGMTAWIRG